MLVQINQTNLEAWLIRQTKYIEYSIRKRRGEGEGVMEQVLGSKGHRLEELKANVQDDDNERIIHEKDFMFINGRINQIVALLNSEFISDGIRERYIYILKEMKTRNRALNSYDMATELEKVLIKNKELEKEINEMKNFMIKINNLEKLND